MPDRPFIPAPNTASVEMIYTSLGQVIENVFHVEGNAPFALADLQALRNVFNTWDSANVALSRPAGVLLARIRCKAIDTQDGVIEDYPLPTPRAGNFTGTMHPLNVTFAFKLQTDYSGRSNRGRMYFPGLTSAITTSNTVDPTWLNSTLTRLQVIITALPAANAAWHLVVTSFRANKTWRVTAANQRVTNFVAVDLNVDCQRRRLTGRGRT